MRPVCMYDDLDAGLGSGWSVSLLMQPRCKWGMGGRHGTKGDQTRPDGEGGSTETGMAWHWQIPSVVVYVWRYLAGAKKKGKR